MHSCIMEFCAVCLLCLYIVSRPPPYPGLDLHTLCSNTIPPVDSIMFQLHVNCLVSHGAHVLHVPVRDTEILSLPIQDNLSIKHPQYYPILQRPGIKHNTTPTTLYTYLT
ncbi:hypothetical protein M441DRAFT_245387 [Trichoderma asperellum CBS 433.97]|uniref:Secreted protein n=1 Tax=Trichoderma asperellum (strain ATCC 204424 / CBS 433.97 / NBRC 101777) TaxID=1042311 RepID=A0A2T3YZP5_TRIA4|nr:hypothetical protein M441DRAFT_245387 [Trichoderma asperellum CBS 433.97]PTB38023.1 hypothetical protein M441DRAFT_245387 [Trichoderma asperellum CBS 433.97]